MAALKTRACYSQFYEAYRMCQSPSLRPCSPGLPAAPRPRPSFLLVLDKKGTQLIVQARWQVHGHIHLQTHASDIRGQVAQFHSPCQVGHLAVAQAGYRTAILLGRVGRVGAVVFKLVKAQKVFRDLLSTPPSFYGGDLNSQT